MCSVCGCSHGEVRIDNHTKKARASDIGSTFHSHAHGIDTTESHQHKHHDHASDGHAPQHSVNGHVHVGHDLIDEGMQSSAAANTPSRLIEIEQSILAKNQRFADDNRTNWGRLGLLALNLVSSPGAGKTSLLVKTLEALREENPLWVIEGDQETSNDADRIRRTGVPAVQINTGRGCHLDAHMVGHAAEDLNLRAHGMLFIENIGNLVCPAGFDLGEGKRVVILSVTEGTDKPIKYPDAFAGADVMIISKIDLLPYVDFDEAGAIELAKRVNPEIEVVRVSAKTNDGVQPWLQWLRRERRSLITAEAAMIERHLADLRTQLTTSE